MISSGQTKVRGFFVAQGDKLSNRSRRRCEMAVVTIRGSMGSGALEIGRQVADRLHVDYVDREIIAGVAARIVWSENAVEAKEMPTGSFLERISEALKHIYSPSASIEGVYLPTWEIPLDDTRYLVGLRSVIRELAESQSVVICGRGSQFILRDCPEVLHVLVIAPLAIRVKRIMKSLKLDEVAAKKEIARFDSSRNEFIKRYFQAEMEDPVYYDLVINTEHLSVEAAASIIVDALPFKERTIGRKTKKQ